MTSEELANLHPKLYHVTEPDAWPTLEQYGLLSTLALLELFEIDPDTRLTLTQQCRAEAVPITHPKYGRVVINDNKPMSEKALLKCLDDGLAPKDWLQLLNRRIFFLEQ